jgi:hypothetical protein
LPQAKIEQMARRRDRINDYNSLRGDAEVKTR